MQEVNTNEKEIQATLDVIKVQIVVSESDLESKQGVRRIIKKYQGRVAEMYLAFKLKLIQRQKRQNEGTKEEFKQLNEQLNVVLKKAQQRPRQQEQKTTDNRIQIIKKQLQNETKTNGILRKQLEQLRYKCKYLDSDKVDGFKNQLKEKERAIAQLNAQIKLFQKLDKQQKNGDSYKKEEELTQKILQQNQEIVHLKKKSIQSKKKEQQLEKNLKVLRQQITLLESKVVSAKPTLQDKQKPQPDSGIEQQYKSLKQKYKQLQNAKKMNDKSSRQQIDTLTLKLKAVERQLAEVKETISRKDKQSSILFFRLKEKERKNFNTLEPIKTARYSQEVLHNSGGLFEVRKSFMGLSWGQGIFRQFDDTTKLPTQKNYRIKRLSFTYFQQHILSLTTDYNIIEGQVGKNLKRQTKTIETFSIPSQYANIKAIQYIFGDYEYIINAEIYCNKGIELIKLTTSKQQVLEIGNTKSIPKCKKHTFDIGTHQKPIAFMGVIQNKRSGGQNRQFLVNLGLQFRRKEVFVRGRPKRLQSSLNRSQLDTSMNKQKNIQK